MAAKWESGKTVKGKLIKCMIGFGVSLNYDPSIMACFRLTINGQCAAAGWTQQTLLISVCTENEKEKSRGSIKKKMKTLAQQLLVKAVCALSESAILPLSVHSLAANVIETKHRYRTVRKDSHSQGW